MLGASSLPSHLPGDVLRWPTVGHQLDLCLVRPGRAPELLSGVLGFQGALGLGLGSWTLDMGQPAMTTGRERTTPAAVATRQVCAVHPGHLPSTQGRASHRPRGARSRVLDQGLEGHSSRSLVWLLS